MLSQQKLCSGRLLDRKKKKKIFQLGRGRQHKERQKMDEEKKKKKKEGQEESSEQLERAQWCAQLPIPAGNALQWPEVGHKCNEPGSLTSGLFSPASDFHLGMTTSELQSSKVSGRFSLLVVSFISHIYSYVGQGSYFLAT